MRYSPDHKGATRKRIVAAAAELFKAKGTDAVSVADVMAAAGLTHGGFYAHFASKDALIAEVLREGRGTSAAKLRAAAGRAGPGRGLAAMVASYLSPDHRAHRERGCIVAALGGEAGRWGAKTRGALAGRAHDLGEALRPYVSGAEASPDVARAVTACMVGGLILARLEADPAEGEKLLEACQRFILAATNPQQRGAAKV